MRALDPAVQAALEAGALVPRDFLWIVARDRETGAPYGWGAWSDVGAVTAEVIDPVSRATVSRTYEGAGGLVEVGDVALISGLTVQVVDIRLSQIDQGAETILRSYDLRRAPVQLHRGFLDPQTHRLVAPAVPRFVGFVDEAPVTTPAEGAEGGIVLTCASHTQELARSSAAKRSDADQRLRNASDGFFRHAATVGSWKIWWGQEAQE